jgi:hypothetical protein
MHTYVLTDRISNLADFISTRVAFQESMRVRDSHEYIFMFDTNASSH